MFREHFIHGINNYIWLNYITHLELWHVIHVRRSLPSDAHCARKAACRSERTMEDASGPRNAPLGCHKPKAPKQAPHLAIGGIFNWFDWLNSTKRPVDDVVWSPGHLAPSVRHVVPKSPPRSHGKDRTPQMVKKNHAWIGCAQPISMLCSSNNISVACPPLMLAANHGIGCH